MLSIAPGWLLWHVMDLALERSPYSERGFLVGMIVVWLAASFVMVKAVVWGFASPRGPRATPGAAAESGRAGTRLKEVLQFAAGALVMVVLASMFKAATPHPDLPAGWTNIGATYITRAIAIQGDTVWAGGPAGIKALDRTSGAVIQTALDRARFRGVADLLSDGEHLWVAHYRGVSRCDRDGHCMTFAPEAGMLAGPATALARDHRGRLWVGTQIGVACFDGAQWETYGVADGLIAPNVDIIFEDRDGAMWFGSASPRGGGLSRLDAAGWTTWSVADGLVHPAVTDIVQERGGALWVGGGFGREGGVSRFAGGTWSRMTKADGLAGEKVRSLHQDTAGRMWFGSEYDGLAIRDGSQWKYLTPYQGLAGWEVLKIVRDRDGVYWLGTERGVSRIASAELLMSVATPGAVTATAGNGIGN